jgi:hypothetical protein
MRESRLVIEPVPTIEEVIAMGTSVEITLEDFHKQRRELSSQAEV